MIDQQAAPASTGPTGPLAAAVSPPLLSAPPLLAGAGGTAMSSPRAISAQNNRPALASMLRRSSRLIHTLQKERGASCALCAAACSSGSTALPGTKGDGNTNGVTTTTQGAADPLPGVTTGNAMPQSSSSHDVDLRSFHPHQWDRSDSFVRLNEIGEEQAPAMDNAGMDSVIPEQLYQNVHQSRRDVDVALKSFLAATSSGTGTFPLEKSLASIRRAVNASAGIVPAECEKDAADDSDQAQQRMANGEESGIGAALRRANLTPPIEEPTEHAEVSGIGAALRMATKESSSIKRTPSMEFGADGSGSGGNGCDAGTNAKAGFSPTWRGPSKERGSAGGFHPILLMFNSVISTLIRTYVVEKCNQEMEILGPIAGEQGQGRPYLHRTSSFASVGMAVRGVQRQFSGGAKYSSSPRAAESNRIRTLSGNRPSDFQRAPPPLSPLKTALSSSVRNKQYEPSLRDLRSLMGSGGVPSSDPSLYAFAGNFPGQPSSFSPAAPKTVLHVATDALGRVLPLPPMPSVASQMKHTRWGSRGGFDLPAPTYVGSYDHVAVSMATSNYNAMARSDSKASFGSGNSGSVHNGQHLIRAFAPPSSPITLASKSISLLSILLSFAELKESMGIERALLTSLLPLSSHHSSAPVVEKGESVARSAPRMLFSDLVLEEENQRKIIRRLRSAARAGRHADAASVVGFDGVPHGEGDVNYQSLLLLIEDSARLTPEMERIQDLIRRDFNIDAFREELSMGDFWQLITIYMDRLHATELLIIEELECCIGNPASVNNDDTNGTLHSNHLSGTLGAQDIGRVLERILAGGTGVETNQNGAGNAGKQCDIGGLVERLQNMPPETVKEQLLASLLVSANRGAGLGGAESEHSEGSSVQFGQKRGEEAAGDDSPDLISPETYTPTDWDIDCYEIEFKKRIGRGVAGTTYLANWSGQPVAVKVAAITDLGVQGWKTECESLRQLHHPNVVRLLGSIFNPNPRTFGLVLEYCEAGDLKSALSRWTPNNFFWKVAGDIANGMSYLHKKGIIHRDIKPANVLLQGNVPSGNYTAQLADFGVAAIMNRDEDEDLTSETGTYRWMAPEVIRHESYSFMADVYSYGVVAWQLLTHEEPFAKQTQIEAAGMVALEHARPPFPHMTPVNVANLIEICWSEDPFERIPFTEIHRELLELKKSLTEEENSWMETAFGHPVYEGRSPDIIGELNDESNAATSIDVVKAMEKKSGARTGKALTRRAKSWSEDAVLSAGDDDKDGKGSKWRLSLLRKSRR